MYHCYLKDCDNWQLHHSTYHFHVAIQFAEHFNAHGIQWKIEYDASDIEQI